MNAVPPHTLAEQAANRLGLSQGRGSRWRGRCPACRYAKETLELRVRDGKIAIRCEACGQVGPIAAMAGLPPSSVVRIEPSPSSVEKARKLWDQSTPAPGTWGEAYYRARGITIPLPPSIRFLPRLWEPDSRLHYPALIGRVQRVPGDEDNAPGPLLASGVHLTFLAGPDQDGVVRKAPVKVNKRTLGQLRHGGVWLNPYEAIGPEMAVAEGIETALSVQQITGFPTVAALSAAGMRSFRWPPHLRRLWIAADNDDPGRQAAKALLGRALQAGLQAEVKVPAGAKNDFNDLLQETK